MVEAMVILEERGLRGAILAVDGIERSVIWMKDNSFSAFEGRTRPRALIHSMYLSWNYLTCLCVRLLPFH